MPAPLLHLGASVLCAHGGQATPTAPSPRVLLSGQPAVALTTAYVVAGCPFAPPNGNGPCVSAQWIQGAARVLIGGAPAVLMNSQALCTPTSTPLQPVSSQMRASGS